MIGTQDLLIALVLGLFLFGAKRLPELANAVGQSMREFRKSATGDDAAPPPSPPTGPAACTACQAALAPDWTHCPHCGTPVPGGPPPGAGSPPPATG